MVKVYIINDSESGKYQRRYLSLREPAKEEPREVIGEIEVTGSEEMIKCLLEMTS